MGTKPGKPQFTYAEAFAALGRFVSQEKMTNVCLLEFDGGMIVTGSRIYSSGESLRRHMATHVLSNDDVLKLVKRNKNATP